MKRTTIYSYIIVTVLIMIAGCKKDITFDENISHLDGDIVTLRASFFSNDTKVSFSEQPDGDTKTAWEVDDRISIYTPADVYVAAFTAESAGTTSTFTKVDGDALTDGADYIAKYGDEVITLATQDGNKSLAHLDSQLYMTGAFKGGESISFKHERAFISLSVKPQLELAKLSLKNGTKTYELALTNVVLDAEDFFTAHFAVDPNAEANRQMDITLSNSDASETWTYTVNNINKEHQKGMRYSAKVIQPIVVSNTEKATEELENTVGSGEQEVNVEITDEAGELVGVELPSTSEESGDAVNVNIDLAGGIAEGEELSVGEGVGDEFHGQLGISVPDDTKGNLNVDLPNATVSFSGNISQITSTTAPNTLKIKTDGFVDKIVIGGGNAEVDGQVGIIERHPNNTDEKTYVRVGENGSVGTLGEGVELYPTTIAVDSVEISYVGNLLLKLGWTRSLKVNIFPEDATNKNVTWTSSEPEVATVDENGVVTAIAAGTTTITVTTEDGSKTDILKVTVTPKNDDNDGGLDDFIVQPW